MAFTALPRSPVFTEVVLASFASDCNNVKNAVLSTVEDKINEEHKNLSLNSSV